MSFLSTLFSVLFPFTHQTPHQQSLTFKPVLFIDRQTVYREATMFKEIEQARKDNDAITRDKKAKTKDTKEVEIISAAHAQVNEELSQKYAVCTMRVWDIIKSTLECLGACGVLDYPGGVHTKAIDPAYDITQHIIKELNNAK